MEIGQLTLPPEILSEIFRHAKPKREAPHILPLEVVLSHVSTDWRSTITADSRVWTTINIYSPKSIPRAEAYLARSGVTPMLNVRIEIYDYDRQRSAVTAGFPEQITTFLQSCIGRCKTLLIFTYREKTAKRIADGLVSSEAPHLERMRINCPPQNSVFQLPDETQSNFLTGGAPTLRFLEIEGIHTLPPLGHVETLHLHNVKQDWFTYDSFKELCKNLHNLKNLSLETQSYIPTWPNDTAGSSLTLKTLQSLRIAEIHPGLLVKFLLTINTPRLESLLLVADTTAFEPLFDSPQFAPGHSKFSKVKYLTLDAYNMRSLSKFGQVFPNLTHFFIPEAVLTGLKFFTEAFTADPPLWPKLDTLALTAKSDRRLATLKEALCNIVLKRGEMKIGLKTFLADGDVIEYLQHASDMLNENLELAAMTTDNFKEPWWLMSHESHPDSIGLS